MEYGSILADFLADSEGNIFIHPFESNPPFEESNPQEDENHPFEPFTHPVFEWSDSDELARTKFNSSDLRYSSLIRSLEHSILGKREHYRQLENKYLVTSNEDKFVFELNESTRNNPRDSIILRYLDYDIVSDVKTVVVDSISLVKKYCKVLSYHNLDHSLDEIIGLFTLFLENFYLDHSYRCESFLPLGARSSLSQKCEVIKLKLKNTSKKVLKPGDAVKFNFWGFNGVVLNVNEKLLSVAVEDVEDVIGFVSKSRRSLGIHKTLNWEFLFEDFEEYISSLVKCFPQNLDFSRSVFGMTLVKFVIKKEEIHIKKSRIKSALKGSLFFDQEYRGRIVFNCLLVIKDFAKESRKNIYIIAEEWGIGSGELYFKNKVRVREILESYSINSKIDFFDFIMHNIHEDLIEDSVILSYVKQGGGGNLCRILEKNKELFKDDPWLPFFEKILKNVGELELAEELLFGEEKIPESESEVNIHVKTDIIFPKVYFEDLKLIRALGKGAYGATYLCTIRNKKGFFVLKMYHDLFATEEKKKQLLERDSLYCYFHPNVVPILSHKSDQEINLEEFPDYEEEWKFFGKSFRGGLILMNYHKINLEQFIDLKKRHNSKFEKIEVVRIMYGIVKGVCHLNFNMIVHRDLHAKNIFLDPGIGRVWVGDFGCALDLRKNKAGFKVTKNEEVVFSLHTSGKYFRKGGYEKTIAPEIVNSTINDVIDYSKSDLYTVGTIGVKLLDLYSATSPSGDQFKEMKDIIDQLLVEDPSKRMEYLIVNEKMGQLLRDLGGRSELKDNFEKYYKLFL